MVAISKRPPISNFCAQEADGWEEVPKKYLVCSPGEEDLTCSFSRRDGVHMLASVIDLTTIHVTIASIMSFRPELSQQEMKSYLLEVVPEVFRTFFGNRQYTRQPDDPFGNAHYLLPIR